MSSNTKSYWKISCFLLKQYSSIFIRNISTKALNTIFFILHLAIKLYRHKLNHFPYQQVFYWSQQTMNKKKDSSIYNVYWEGGGGMAFRVLPITLLAMIFLLGSTFGNLTHSRAQNRHLQRAITHDHLTFVLNGVRERAMSSVQPDPIMLIHFPEINHQLKVSFKE